uniref:Putative 5'-nucleotidase/apyrase n=1 Tax=Ixodes ricinus TaxID=34613 RepID=A0A147BVH3_IXORI
MVPYLLFPFFYALIECESVSTVCNVAGGDNTICFDQHYRLILWYLTFGAQNIKFDYSAFFWKRKIKSHSYSCRRKGERKYIRSEAGKI